MSRQEFISTLNYESIKDTLAKVLKTNPEELVIITYKSGDFKLDFRNSSGTFGIISSNAVIARLFTSELKIRPKHNVYEAKIVAKLSNKNGEYLNDIGTLRLNKNKWLFTTK